MCGAALRLAGPVRNAGSVFLGHYCPEPLGTISPARTTPAHHGLRALFQPPGRGRLHKAQLLLLIPPRAWNPSRTTWRSFADTEGLHAHAVSATIRRRGAANEPLPRQQIRLPCALRAGEQPKDREYIKLNANESPYPPSPSVLEALRTSEAAALNLYPDAACRELSSLIAAQFGLGEGNVLLANGSGRHTELLLSRLLRKGRGVPGHQLRLLRGLRGPVPLRRPAP